MSKIAMAEHDDSFGGRARESVTGWWGRSRRFLAEVRNELSRVTWPSRKEVYATTLVVILTSIFFGIYLYGIDLVLNALMGWLYTRFGAA
jgi:preprotein translocase subunit SecE